MTLNKVTVICDQYDGAGNILTKGTGYFAPSAVVTDAAGHHLIGTGPPVAAVFRVSALPSVELIACDNDGLLPSVWGWVYTPPAASGLAQQTYVIDFANGATQYLSALTPSSTPSVLASQQPPWITLPGGWYGGPWFAAKNAGFTSPAWILFDGDSVTNGVNPDDNGFLATGWPDQLRTAFLASSGASVHGDFYPLWSYTEGSGAQNPVDEGFASLLTGASTFEGGFGTCLACGSSNAWMQIISTGSIPGWTGGDVTGFDIVWYDWGACTWEFIIDGGEGSPTPTVSGATWTGSAWQVTASGGAATAGNVKKVTVRGLTAGTHTIEHGQVSSAGNMMPIGLSLFTGSSGGVGFVRSAYSGRRAVDSATPGGTNLSYSGTFTAFPNDRPSLWSGSGPTNATAQITPAPFGFPTQPSLAFIGYGINDCATYVSPDAYGDAIQRKIIAIRRGVPNANIGLIAMSYPDLHNSDNDLAGNGGRYSRWKRVLADLAAAYSCAYIDIDAKWGGTPVGQGFQESGNVHPTTAGSADIAAVVGGII